MSRTNRWKEGGIHSNWVNGFYIREFTNQDGAGYEFRPILKHTREYRIRAAKLHSDGTLKGYKGPRWFRNLYGERIQRRDAKFQLHKFKYNNDYEVCLVVKQPLPYWL